MIHADRLKECSDLLAMALNPVDSSETFDFEGQEVRLAEFLPLVIKHLNKVVLKNPEKSEEIFTYLVDAIHYTLGVTDEPPETVFYSPNEMKIRETGYTQPAKFKIN